MRAKRRALAQCVNIHMHCGKPVPISTRFVNPSCCFPSASVSTKKNEDPLEHTLDHAQHATAILLEFHNGIRINVLWKTKQSYVRHNSGRWWPNFSDIRNKGIRGICEEACWHWHKLRTSYHFLTPLSKTGQTIFGSFNIMVVHNKVFSSCSANFQHLGSVFVQTIPAIKDNNRKIMPICVL